jgi:predicted phage terminase large subunit-like protein
MELTKFDYPFYVEYTHEGRWIPARHLLFICEQVQEFIESDTGHAYDILILQMPPQHGKSQSVTETLPSWYLGKNPLKRVIQVSYNEETAERFCRRNKEKIRQFGQNIFGIEISKTTDRSTEFELSNNVGRMISRGIMSGITSNPANLFIIDDPIKNRLEADSETYRERVWDEWQNSIKTRLAAGAKIIIILTRWHEDDLAGRVIANEKHVQVINLPCEAEENDLIGRTPGQALFPEIGKGDTWLKEFKQSYINDSSGGGLRAWLALFQGRPTAQEGNMIKRYWWRYWKPKGMELPPVTVKTQGGQIIHIEAVDLPDIWDEQLQSWDCTFKSEVDNDMVCGGIWGRRAANYFLLDLINEHMDIIQTIENIQSFSKKWPRALRKLIEDKANGPAVIQILQRKLPGLVAVNPEGGKIARANAVSPAIESGNVYIPHPMVYSWVNSYLDQLSSFPQGKNDDMVDMTTQALNKLIYRTSDQKEPLPRSAPRTRLNSYTGY